MNQRHLFQNILYNVFSCRCWGSKRYSTSMFNWDLARCRPKTLSQLKTQFVSCNMGLCKLGLPQLHESLDLWIKAGFQEIQEIWRSSMKKSKFPYESRPNTRPSERHPWFWHHMRFEGFLGLYGFVIANFIGTSDYQIFGLSKQMKYPPYKTPYSQGCLTKKMPPHLFWL